MTRQILRLAFALIAVTHLIRVGLLAGCLGLALEAGIGRFVELHL